MKIRIQYSKFIKMNNYPKDSTIVVPDQCTVFGLLQFLGVPRAHRGYLFMTINDELAIDSMQLKENDFIKLFPILAGG